MKKLQSKNLSRSIRLGIGIFCINCLFFFTNFPATRYEIQSHLVDLNGKHDFRKLSQIGVETITVRVFNDSQSSGGLYFSNSMYRVPENYLDRLNVSPLNVWAWMIGRNFSWTGHSLLFDTVYENGAREKIKKYDLFNPLAVNRIKEIFAELAAKDIQGILIQDDLIIRANEGYSQWGKSKFLNLTGVTAKEDKMALRDSYYQINWRRIKVDQVVNVLREIVSSCRAVKPEIKLGLNIHYETPLYVTNAENWYAHNLQKLLQTGIDRVYLMAYHRQIKEEMKLGEVDNLALFRKIVEAAYRLAESRLVVKLQIRDWNSGERIGIDEMLKYMNQIPGDVSTICLTPVQPGDLEYIGQLLEAHRDGTFQ